MNTSLLESQSTRTPARRTWRKPARKADSARPMLENLEERALFSVSTLGATFAPAIQPTIHPGQTQGIIAILIGL